MPANHLWKGRKLLYPENWSLQEDDDTLNIESPSGSFMTISSTEDIEQAFQRAKATMESEYEEVETEVINRVVGETLLEGVTQRFVYLDLIVTSHLFRLEVEEEEVAPLLVQIQGEDRDLDKLQPVFDAILASLAQGNLPSQKS